MEPPGTERPVRPLASGPRRLAYQAGPTRSGEGDR